MAMTGGEGKGEHTKDLASFVNTVKYVFLLDRVAHGNLHIPFESLA
jgi:hypothetical protein